MWSDDDFDQLFNYGTPSGTPAAAALLPGTSSRHETRTVDPGRCRLLAGLPLPGPVTSVVLRRFEPGDWHTLHRAGESPLSEDCDWVALVVGHDEERNGVTYWTAEGFRFREDRTLDPLVLDPAAWCWTRPTVGPVRRLLTAGGRHG